MAAMDVYDMSSMDNIMDEWRTQAHKKMYGCERLASRPDVKAVLCLYPRTNHQPVGLVR